MECTVLTADGLTSAHRGTSCERDPSENGRIQDIASEVLRLRNVQSQHRTLEGQLQAAVEKLRQLPSEKVLQMRSYLEHGLRLAGAAGTLGGQNGVGPESLCGLMECLCTVSDEQLTSRRQDELLTVTRRLLQDPPALLDRLAKLPFASASQSRRLAPFLLSCDSSWRGHLSEAGQCYEALRTWLSCYYQFSLISNQVTATNEQLLQQERLMEELGRETEGGTGGAAGLCKPAAWRQYSGVRRSSSVQSTSSVGSRRSQSPSTDRAALVGLRNSPRTSASGAAASTLGRGTARESALKTSMSARGNLTDRTSRVPSGTAASGLAQGLAASTSSLQPLHAPRGHATSPGRSQSPGNSQSQMQQSSSRTSLTDRGPRNRAEASPRLSRFGGPPSAAGALASARTRIGSSNATGSPNVSPRIGHTGHSEAAKPPSARRQIVPAVRSRRPPSQEKNPMPSAKGACAASLHVRPGELGCVAEGSPTKSTPPPQVGGAGPQGASPQAMPRSRSLQTIGSEPPGGAPGRKGGGGDPPSAEATPPVSSRGLGGSRLNSARISQGSPNGRVSVLSSSQPNTARTSVMQQQVPPRVGRLSSTGGYQPLAAAAGSGGTPAGAAAAAHLRRGQHSRSGLQLPSTRRVDVALAMAPPSAAAHSPLAGIGDAGSGGTVGGDTRQDWSLVASRSSPALEVRTAMAPTTATYAPVGSSRYVPPPMAAARQVALSSFR
mmetsp:Transcript_53498/g.174107  ORF Transcript_53498/g.174107 Transcript_53498/m.174107 type:complete len:721 (+) Transcript_53498:116-2278(+)